MTSHSTFWGRARQRWTLLLTTLQQWPWRQTYDTLRQRFREDRLGLTAGSLTFTTTIAVVPLFTVMLALFSAFPTALVTCVAGLALLGTIGSSLHGALQQDEEREAALLTFLITASGISLLGVGSACWGLLVGVALHQVNRLRA